MVCGVAIVDKNKCKPNKCGVIGVLEHAWLIEQGKDCIVKDENFNKDVVMAEICIGCRICLKCPFDALAIVNLPEELKENPIPGFGINSFRLFGLPIPKKNMIISLVWRNGIGKTTALNILT